MLALLPSSRIDCSVRLPPSSARRRLAFARKSPRARLPRAKNLIASSLRAKGRAIYLLSLCFASTFLPRSRSSFGSCPNPTPPEMSSRSKREVAPSPSMFQAGSVAPPWWHEVAPHAVPSASNAMAPPAWWTGSMPQPTSYGVASPDWGMLAIW